jgi:hypothetical protein
VRVGKRLVLTLYGSDRRSSSRILPSEAYRTVMNRDHSRNAPPSKARSLQGDAMAMVGVFDVSNEFAGTKPFLHSTKCHAESSEFSSSTYVAWITLMSPSTRPHSVNPHITCCLPFTSSPLSSATATTLVRLPPRHPLPWTARKAKPPKQQKRGLLKMPGAQERRRTGQTCQQTIDIRSAWLLWGETVRADAI